MPSSLWPPPSAALPRVLLTGVALGAWACMPSRPLHDYSSEQAGSGGSAGSGRGGAAGSAGSAGSGGAAAGAGGQSGAAPQSGGAGGDEPSALADAGSESGDAAIIRLDAALPVAPCAADELLGPDDRCYFFDQSLASWGAARAACQARGAGWDLARVRLAEQSTFLGDTLAFEGWIGATDAANESQWLWVGDVLPFWIGNGTTGSASGGAYTNWNATEPNGGTATNCARAVPRSIIGAGTNAPWADLDCATALGAICESGPLP